MSSAEWDFGRKASRTSFCNFALSSQGIKSAVQSPVSSCGLPSFGGRCVPMPVLVTAEGHNFCLLLLYCDAPPPSDMSGCDGGVMWVGGRGVVRWTQVGVLQA